MNTTVGALYLQSRELSAALQPGVDRGRFECMGDRASTNGQRLNFDLDVPGPKRRSLRRVEGASWQVAR